MTTLREWLVQQIAYCRETDGSGTLYQKCLEALDAQAVELINLRSAFAFEQQKAADLALAMRELEAELVTLKAQLGIVP